MSCLCVSMGGGGGGGGGGLCFVGGWGGGGGGGGWWGVSESVKKRKMTKIFFTDNIQWSSKTL